MAEAVLQAVVQVLTEKLTSLLQSEIGLIMCRGEEIEKLSSNLTTIQSVLEDAEDKQLQSKPIQNWLIKVNDIAYEMEDVLDEWATETSKLKHRGTIFNWKKIVFRCKIGRRMKEVAEKLDAVAKERDNFHLREIVAPQPSKIYEGRETGPLPNEPDHIYGRDEDRDKIVDMLVNQVADCQQLSVLPIIGIGGLGKTTLAQLVYNDEIVTQHFPIKLWVSVSDNFDLNTLLKKVIEFATKSASGLENLGLATLEYQLLDVLSQKRYLLILDDVWNENEDAWFKLKSILACGSRGASVVVTTRVQKVAAIMGTLPPHCLKELWEEHCWLLFRLRAFGQENEEYPNLETIGRRIVKKCAGVPLAAKALGGLLRFKREEMEWIHVEKSEIWNLSKEEISGDEISILPVLRLSYHHLPLVLRRCFVYCAVFPKDSEIEKKNLIFHWIAHGCISSNEKQELEDIGNQIWNELVLRSFFQEVKIRGGKTIFKMHDLLHNLAQSIMNNKILGAQMRSNSGSPASNSKIREVHLGEHSEISPSSLTLQVSTLTTIMDYNRLRILKLNGRGIEELPTAIGKLKHLRYLDLTKSSIRTLPHKFCDLWNLQILILNHCHGLKSLPKNIRYMINLRHIFLEECYGLSHMPSGIGKLTSLKSLSLYILGHKTGNQLDELEPLNLGGKLEIRHLERVQNHVNAKKANLVNKPNLRELVLDWEGDSTSELTKRMDEEVLEALEPHTNLETLRIGGFKGSYFPLWMIKMENVTQITINYCPNCSRLPPLGDLPRLKFLHLSNLVGLEYIMEDEIQGQNPIRPKFPSLVDLTLEHLPNLKGLSKEEVGELMFSNLQHLDIYECELLILPPLPTHVKLEARSCSLLNLSSFYKLQTLSSFVLDFDKISTTCNIPEDALEGLCNLKELSIRNAREHHLPEKWFQDLKSLTKLTIKYSNIGGCFPEEWLGHLTALEELTIYNCRELLKVSEEVKYLYLLKRLLLLWLDNMVSLPQGIQHVTSLQSLTLYKLPQLTSLPDWLSNLTSLKYLTLMSLPQLTSLPDWSGNLLSLQYLTLDSLPQLALLPDWLGNLTSLQSLKLDGLPRMASLPDWLGDLTSLTELHIESCPKVPSLPSSIQGMTNLRSLRILDCSQLERRCEKEKGEDWHKIAHIPHLDIY